jgi:peroxiredoxin
MKTSLQSLAICGAMALALGSCQQNKFTVEGTVEGAADSVLYFYNMSLTGPQLLDSAKLDADGSFSFQAEAPEAPDFYLLRIHDQIINLSIDSTETVTIKAQWPDMSARYEVTGSDNCQKIKELALRQQDLARRAMTLENDMSLSRQQAQDSLLQMIESYKQQIIGDYIYQEPSKAYAYFALFQTLGQYLIFNPHTNRNDVKAFAAVATSWDTFHPGSERGENLHNITLESMKNMRLTDIRNAEQIDPSKIVESGVLELELTDNHGQVRTLTGLKGSVVLLDFHSFTLKDSPQRILMLRDLYNKYHAQGLEIYQVSVDQDEHFWRQMTGQLPWISVRDAEGSSLSRYNVQTVPDFFLIDRANQLQKRAAQMADLEQEIKRLL